LVEPDDSSYVFGGFCPITIRLIEQIISGGWGGIKEGNKANIIFYCLF